MTIIKSDSIILYTKEYDEYHIFIRIRTGIQLNFALNLLILFQNLAANFFETSIKNKSSKLGAKFNFTPILKISWENIEKCQILALGF